MALLLTAEPSTLISELKAKRTAPFDVMLTCYTLFERNGDEQRADRKFLRSWPWSHVVLDEAHAVKNRNAARTIKLRRIALEAKRRIMLTGTPLQNDLEELRNLLLFLLPDVFTEQDEAALQQDATEASEALTERMKAVLGPFVLRRLKSEVAGQLAPKKQVLEALDMTPRQQRLYQAAASSLRAELLGSVEKGKPGAPRDAAALVRRIGKQKVNNMFTHLRKIAQHPLLVRSRFSDEQVSKMARLAHSRGVFGEGASQEMVRAELAGYSDHGLAHFAVANGRPFREFSLPADAVLDSAKARLLAELLPSLQARGSRPLIFSQWTSVLDLLEDLLDALGLAHQRLDGSTAVLERLALCDAFNAPGSRVFAFLLSTRAGGQGLNLTGANTVILHDVDFNPQIDRQAEDRVHRLGQTRSVTVYRLVTRGTVDEGIHALAQRKLALDAAVLDGITASGAGGGSAKSRAGGKGADGEHAAMGQLLQALLAGGPTEAAAQETEDLTVSD